MDFMDGVTLIKECMKLSTTGLIMIIMLTLIMVALSIALLKICYAVSEYDDEGVFGLCGVISLILGFGVVIYLVAVVKIIPKEYNELNGKYEVVISSDIDMNEFQNRYDIIDYKDGKYTIMIKENK